MTGRPPTPIGLTGRISTRDVTPAGADAPVWLAECRVRDADGVSRRVRARGRSKSAAERALKERVAQRHHAGGHAVLTGAHRVRDAGELWLRQCRAATDAGELAPRTFDTYESAWRLWVLPGLGELRLREATTGRCEVWQAALRQQLGPSRVKKARAVLSGVLGYAARMDAIPANPVRDMSPIPGGRARQPRAMTADERARWLAWMDSNVADAPNADRKTPRPRTAERTASIAAARALGDITRLALATGGRIGEVMAVGWDDVDLQAGTVHLRWHLVRVKGEGLVRMAGTKRGDGRLLRLPSWALDMLLRRRVDSDSEPVFPDELGQWRDPNLVMRWIRWSRDAAGFPWLTSHVWRQTVITVLDEAGLSTRIVADQVGHSNITQTQQYMQRNVASDRAAEALEDLI